MYCHESFQRQGCGFKRVRCGVDKEYVDAQDKAILNAALQQIKTAERKVQADWEETDDLSPAYIKHKPELMTEQETSTILNS